MSNDGRTDGLPRLSSTSHEIGLMLSFPPSRPTPINKYASQRDNCSCDNCRSSCGANLQCHSKPDARNHQRCDEAQHQTPPRPAAITLYDSCLQFNSVSDLFFGHRNNSLSRTRSTASYSASRTGGGYGPRYSVVISWVIWATSCRGMAEGAFCWSSLLT